MDQVTEQKTNTGEEEIHLGFDWESAARYVLLSRELDRIEEEQLTPQGKVTYQFSARGHELSQVLLALNLDHPHDAAAVYYRSRPFMLASGFTPSEALSAGMALTGSPSEGRDVGVVFNMPRRYGATILPASGDVGAQYSPAAGWAQSILYRQNMLEENEWQGALAAAHGGEGSVAANGFWAALNISTSLRLPLLFFIEDNGYGISVPGSLQTPGGNIAKNLKGYAGLKTLEGRGWDPVDALDKTRQAVDHVRSGEGPCLLRMEVARLTGHTFIDDQSYKSRELREKEAGLDPVIHLKDFLLRNGYTQEDWERLEQEAKQNVSEAVASAHKNRIPDPKEIRRYLFFEGISSLQGGLRPENANIPTNSAQPQHSGPRINFIEAVRRTLSHEMELNPRILVFGEDVGEKGGVHGATAGIQARFGKQRVFDTSLNEEGIVGRAAGMALAGLLPVPEIQFRKYADPAHEQITDLGTLRWRTANKFAAPLVVRIPVGFGKKTGDPWHSVTAEAVYAHTLGWRIAFPSNAEDAAGLLRSALRGDDPTFFFEHRALLDTPESRRPYPGDDYCLPFGSAKQLFEGDEVLVVTWGAMVHRCLQAVEPFKDRVSILDLRTIIPWDQEAVLEAVRKTGKVLIVHEDTITSGFAGEIAAVISSEAFEHLDAPIQRLATPDIPIPYNYEAMEAILPSVASIRSRIEWMLEY